MAQEIFEVLRDVGEAFSGDLPEGWGFTILGFRGPGLGFRVYGQGVRVFGFRVHKKPEDNDTSTPKFQTTRGFRVS